MELTKSGWIQEWLETALQMLNNVPNEEQDFKVDFSTEILVFHKTWCLQFVMFCCKELSLSTLRWCHCDCVGGVGLVYAVFIKKIAQSTFACHWEAAVGVDKICSTRALKTDLGRVPVLNSPEKQFHL